MYQSIANFMINETSVILRLRTMLFSLHSQGLKQIWLNVKTGLSFAGDITMSLNYGEQLNSVIAIVTGGAALVKTG